ncbi:MAG TPA: hypothetical protein VKU92_10540 [Acidimicrobiales bacterium]|nr:hypothetical protein [Acidimicrobiales bacterium]
MPKNAPDGLPRYPDAGTTGASDGGGSDDHDGDSWDEAGEKESGGSSPYKPPNFFEALKMSSPWAGRSSRNPTTGASRARRPPARPASGTAAEAMAVRYLDQRERLIAAFLAVLQLILAVIFYFQMRRIVVKPTKKPKLSVHQAHIESLNYHHAAPWFLLVNAILALGIVTGVISKRRSLVGFTLILAGLGLVSYLGVIGFIYVGVGVWLIFRARKRAVNAQARATTGSTRPRRGAVDTPANPDAKVAADRRELAAAAARTAAAVRQPPAPSKRYTPPKRPLATAKAATNGSGEKRSRLAGWFRR